jgi:hypothetical protein
MLSPMVAGVGRICSGSAAGAERVRRSAVAEEPKLGQQAQVASPCLGQQLVSRTMQKTPLVMLEVFSCQQQ